MTFTQPIFTVAKQYAEAQTLSLDDDEGEDDSPYADFDVNQYGAPLPDNFDAYDSARNTVTDAPSDLLRQKEFYLSPMTLTEAILSVSSPCKSCRSIQQIIQLADMVT